MSVVPVTSPRGGFEFKSVPSYKLRSFWRPIVQGACLPQPTKQLPLLIHKKPVLSVSSRYMDSYTRLREREVILGVDDPSLRTPTGELLNKVLISWMTGMTLLCPNMDTDMSVQSYAEKYHSKQARHVEMLFSTIVDTLPEDTGKRRKTRKLFFALECFQSAVTELGGIFLPHGFAKKFTKTGFYCLPKPLFLQYISRGLITVSKELVLTLYEKGAHKTDPEFFYTVLCGLPLYTAVDILLSDPQSPPPPLFVVDHFLSRYPNVLPSAKLELTDNSPFFPLETLLLSLKKGVTNLRAYKLPPGITAPQNMRNFLDGIEVISRIADLVNTEYFLPTLDVEMLQADKVTKKL